ncbi:MAG: LysR family transcriptional regulator [Candidatus Sedimenticola sp. PURPLELP]
MNIDVRHILHIQSLVHHENFTRAAKSLGLTQSALSRSILSLEKALDVTLINRQTGKIGLTPYGELVLKRGQRILTELSDLMQDIEEMKGGSRGYVNMAFEAATSHIIMGDVLVNLHRNYPNIHASSTTGDPSFLLQDVLTGKYDILVGPTTYSSNIKGLAIEVLQTFQTHVIVRANHPLALLRGATLNNLFDYPYAGYRFAPALYERWSAEPGIGIPANAIQSTLDVISTDNIPSICKVLLETNAFTWGIAGFFPEEILSGKLVFLNLPNTPIDIELGISYQASRHMLPAHLAVKQEIIKQYRQTAENEKAILQKLRKTHDSSK